MADNSFRRIALVNPRWDFSGSRYWSCREPHLPLELLYSEALLQQAGFSTMLVDAHLEGLSLDETARRLADFCPDLIVLTSAPSYLFWRCPPPELDVPRAFCSALSAIAPVAAIGPHGSATPGYVLAEIGCQAVVRGEPEEELVRIASGDHSPATVWAGEVVASGKNRDSEALEGRPSPSAPVKEGNPGFPGRRTGRVHDPHSPEIARVDVRRLPSLEYRDYPLELRTHRHHVFWGEGRGAEVEYSRGCPYGCSFCNRRFFRSRYRERPVEKVLAEIRRLRARGVDYVYFIDEVFGLGRCDALLDALAQERTIQFGCQTRIDLWDESRLDRLALAGCISVEFGLESPFPDVQDSLNKGYRLEGDRILDLMVHAKQRIAWVQGDLMEPPGSNDEIRSRTEEWRQRAIAQGVWMSEPVPLFLYPGADLHDQIIGPLDDDAWKRAREYDRNRDGQCGS